MTFYQAKIKMPRARIGVLIGKGGAVRRRLESLTGARLSVDSRTGEVTIRFDSPPGDPLMPSKLVSVIRAISRGFSPEKAFNLLDDEYVLEVIDLRNYVGDRKNALIRIRGRLIGERGRARAYIEGRTGTSISVYGHTVSIIGRHYGVIPAKEAVIALLKGARHSTAYRIMEKKLAEMREIENLERRLASKETGE